MATVSGIFETRLL